MDGKTQENKQQEFHYQGIEKDNYEILVLEKEKLTDRTNED